MIKKVIIGLSILILIAVFVNIPLLIGYIPVMVLKLNISYYGMGIIYLVLVAFINKISSNLYFYIINKLK